MKKNRKKKRSRKKRKQERAKETSAEMTFRILSKGRGGRASVQIEDKTKYNRKKKHKNEDNEI